MTGDSLPRQTGSRSEHPNTTRCKCGHVWRPMAWQERTRNVRCPQCGGWNQAGATDIRHRLAGTRAIEAAIKRALRSVWRRV